MIRIQIKMHVTELNFLDTFFQELDGVELCTDQDRVWLHGIIGELGEAIIEYRLDGDRLTYFFQFLDQEESIAAMMNEAVQKLPHYTPSMLLISCLRWSRQNRGSENGMVPETIGKEEAASREQTDA